MYQRLSFVSALIISLLLTAAAWAQDRAASPPVLRMESQPTGAVVSLRGCVHFDYLGYDRDEIMLSKETGSQENDFIVRRARLYFQGKLGDLVGFYVQAGLEIPEYPFLDAFVILNLAEGVQLRAGQLKMPFSQERLRSYLHQPVMERSPAAMLELRRSQGIIISVAPGEGGLMGELGLFTGENMNQHNTDDHFEYVGRFTFKPDKIIDGFPGSGQVAASAAYGRRDPERSAPTSFVGRTMNNFTWFQAIPVGGYRTRYEADAEWRYRSFLIAGEWIQSVEERENVTVNVDTDGDGASDGTYTDSLDPLEEYGWYGMFVWVLTGEDYNEYIVPKSDWGAVSLVVRYGEVHFDAGDLPAAAEAALGSNYVREVNAVSTTVGREDVSAGISELYAGFDWDLKQGAFVQFAALWQWYGDSSPFGDDRTEDINYRARIGVVF